MGQLTFTEILQILQVSLLFISTWYICYVVLWCSGWWSALWTLNSV